MLPFHTTPLHPRKWAIREQRLVSLLIVLVISENQQLLCRHNRTHTHVHTAKGPAAGRRATWSLLGASPPWGLPSCVPACLAAALRPCSPAPQELPLDGRARRCPVLAGSRVSSGLRAWHLPLLTHFFFHPRASTISCQFTNSCLATARDKGRTSNSNLPLRNTNTPFTFSQVQGLPMLPGN